MARKLGQIFVEGANARLVRAYLLGRDPQTGQRKYHNQTIQARFAEHTGS
jgi:hypothetical protein